MKTLKKLYFRIRFGKVSPVVMADINGTACEIAYHDRKGHIVGYWAYGSFDPSFPYSE